MALTFYYGSGSPFAWKVWLILEHKGIPYEFRLLSFDRGDTKSAEFRAVNPRGKVPAIVDGSFALWESAIIAEYLEERYPQKPLLPNDAQACATVRRIAAEADSYLSPAVTQLFELTLIGRILRPRRRSARFTGKFSKSCRCSRRSSLGLIWWARYPSQILPCSRICVC